MTNEEIRAKGAEALRQAEAAEARAAARSDQLRNRAYDYLVMVNIHKLPWWRRWWLKRRYVKHGVFSASVAPTKREVRLLAAAWQSEDPKWRVAVSSNRWFLDQAAAYGANVEDER